MTLDDAVERTRDAFARMDTIFGEPVFDEWAFVLFSGKRARILHYTGPRKEAFLRKFVSDFLPLAPEMEKQSRDPGEFGFSRTAEGTHFDAFIVAGESLYLLCNHTAASMEALSQRPAWRSAQTEFVALSEGFLSDPVAGE